MDFGYNPDEAAAMLSGRAAAAPGLGISYLDRPTARTTLDRLVARSRAKPSVVSSHADELARDDGQVQHFDAAPLCFSDALDYVARTIREDGGDHFLSQLVEAVGRDALASAMKAKPNINPFPLGFTTLEVSIWDNLPVGSRRMSKGDKTRDPKRFNVEVHASVKGNRKPLDRPDWIANVCELLTPEEFKANMVPSRWGLRGDTLAQRVLADATSYDMLAGRMKIRVKGRGMGGEHVYRDHYVCVPRQPMIDRELPAAIFYIGDKRVLVPLFDRKSSGGDAFPMQVKPNGHKSVVILQSRHSVLPNLLSKAWPTGEAAIGEL